MNKNPQQPNVVFILTDDQGYWALGCNGNREIHTPHIDALAAQGVRMENFFCTSPVCSPARASLLTGRIPSQHGILDWVRGGNGESPEDPPLEYLDGIPGYTDLLAQHGYTCGISGKWHMGHSLKPQKSHSHWFVTVGGGGTYHNAPVVKNGKILHAPGYLTDVITEDAVSFLDECSKKEQPFYLQVSYTAPHSPLVDQHPEKYLKMYENCKFESCPQDPRHPWMPHNPTEIQFSEQFCVPERKSITVRDLLTGYYASISAMDQGVGKIIARLEQLGLRDNTLICFLSDNGYSCGQHGIWGKGTCTDPINMYDTSVKVPAIFSHPARIHQGVVCDALLSGYDFMPTLLEYLNIQNPEASALPGQSFCSLLKSKKGEPRKHVVIYDELGPVRMIRTKEWKYIHRYPFGPHELYDLLHDPGERFNLLDECRTFHYTNAELEQIVLQMRHQLEEWFVKYTLPAFDGRHLPVAGRGQLHALDGSDQSPAFFQRQAAAEYVRPR